MELERIAGTRPDVHQLVGVPVDAVWEGQLLDDNFCVLVFELERNGPLVPDLRLPPKEKRMHELLSAGPKKNENTKAKHRRELRLGVGGGGGCVHGPAEGLAAASPLQFG